jgi:hypothetical protein
MADDWLRKPGSVGTVYFEREELPFRSQEVENCLSAHPDVPGIAAGAELERRLIDFARNGKLRKHLLRDKYAG